MNDPMFKVKTIEERADYGRFTIEPLEQGYGHTLGNSLRRVLLSSLKGAAITQVQFDNVKHSFSTIPGMKEDVVEFILNLKKIRLQLDSEKEYTIKLEVSGPKTVAASDLDLPAGVTILNKDQYLGTLNDKKTKVSAAIKAKSGYGYVPAEDQDKSEYGEINIDALFSPVKRVNYKVEETRVGRMTNLDKLIVEIWTDGTITPSAALKNSAKILTSYFLQVYEPKAEATQGVVVTPAVSDEVLKMTIEELDLPMRITNSLKNGGIETVGKLLGTPRKDLSKVKNLGVKSLSLIEEKLREKGVALTV
ncbi:DNA-directed RNA polymerase subunit alpha [Candidatus Gottesmanbacteria bacterium]|nr:DNA-directed RNA polymerase subunit alpha [Candidatus Gottesmanbacteria bacterium]